MRKAFSGNLFFIAAMFCALIFTSSQAIAETNLLQNYSFESNSGWWSCPDWWSTDKNANAAGITTGGDNPYDGSWVFSVANDWGGGPSDAWGYAAQVITPTLNTGDTVTYKMHIKTENGYTGEAKLKIEFLNSSDAVLASAVSQSYGNNTAWTLAMAEGTVPSGAVKIKAYCLSEHMGTGSKAAHFDDGSVVIYQPLSKASPTNEQVWRLNCGATSDYTDPSGNLWMKDESYASLSRWGFTNGNQASSTTPISGTDLDPVFQTYRWGGTNMSYKIEVPNGVYQVKLMFAETYWTQSGKRIFDVALEGVRVLTHYDIYATKGFATADEYTFQATVNDGRLDITFPRISRDNALICGIEVKPVNVSDTAFLDFIQKKMFWYFWNEVDPQTGLVKDKENDWGSPTENVASIASCGFALSTYTVAASRGWISDNNAYLRVMTTLNTFDTLLPNIHGFWYHFVDMSTGARAGSCELSTVDSAIFIMGALQAGEYFRSTHPDVAAKADALYRRMEWAWFTNVGEPWQQKFINMGWKPENDGVSFTIPSGKPEGGYYCTGFWSGYCESVFVDLLGLSSPTYYIDGSAWTDMGKWWADSFGYHFIQLPQLFTHQYHNLYYDLAGKHDTAADYFGNAIKATLVNRETCLNDPQQRYETNRWGLTSCDGPGGYTAYGSEPGGSHDGTVAPTAAITSVIFTPQESIAAAKYMYFQYKHHIWGKYGFCDAFNVGQGFKSNYVIGIDNGPMIIAVENYRTGMVKNTFMSNQYAQDALSLAGFRSFTQEPLITESSCETADMRGIKAFDGNWSTRWASQSSDPQWIEADYGSPKVISGVTIVWETAYGRSYKIQVSDDEKNWTDVYSTTTGDGGQDVIAFSPVTARYLRLYGTERGTAWGYSIWEMAVNY